MDPHQYLKWMSLKVWVFVLGTLIGSFLNVAIVRLPQNLSLVRPRSRCRSCNHFLGYYDLVPLLSYLFLKGRCRYCQHSVSIRYPVVEGLTGLLFLAEWLQFPLLNGVALLILVRNWIFLSLLLVITFIDLEHRIIPDVLSLGGLLLGWLTSFFVPHLGLKGSLLGSLLGFGLFYSFSWIYYQIRGQIGLGAGDIKFLAMLGSFLGPFGVWVTIGVSSIVGSLAGLIWAVQMGIASYRETMQFAIPFGPFLVIGGLLTHYFGNYLWNHWI